MITNYLYPQKADTTNINEIGIPVIKNYTPKEYGAHNQNWAIVQDKRGIMYFGNTDGLLEYDGVSWRLISIPNEIVRSLGVSNKTENGVIYVGGIDEFGYLAPDKSGTLEYNSLKQFLPKTKNNIGNVRNILVNSDGVYFQTFSHLVRWSSCKDEKETNEKIKVWEANTTFNNVFVVDNKLYVNEQGIGLSLLTNDTLCLINGGEKFANKQPVLMLPYLNSNREHTILIGTQRNGFYLYDSLSLYSFKTEADNFVLKNELYQGVLLTDSTIALATYSGGIVRINKKGKILQYINKSMGLKTNTPSYIYPDKQNNLWLATQNGIEKVIIPSPISIFNELNNLESNVYEVLRHKGRLYTSTFFGVYYLKEPGFKGMPSKFVQVDGINTQTLFLFSTYNTLFAATRQGIFIIKNGSAKLIKSEWDYPYCIYQSRTDTNKLYVGISNGLALLQYKNGKWINSGRIDGINEMVQTIEEDSVGNLWLGTFHQGVLKVRASSINNKNEKIQIEYFKNNHNLPKGTVGVVNINNKILFATKKGLYHYDSLKNKFINDSTYGLFLADTNTSIRDICEDTNKNVWVSAINNKKSIFGLAEKQKDSTYLWQSHSYLFEILDINNTRLNIYSDKKNANQVWIAATEDIISYNFKRKHPIDYNNSFPTLIRKVVVNNDSVIFGGNFYENKHFSNFILTPNDISISFEYASANFFNESKNQYRYYLENFDKTWSSWTKKTRKEYTNIPAGDYHFRVSAKDIFGNISNDASFSFTVLPHWYQTWWAYLIYFAIIGLVFLITVKWRVRYLEKEKDKLEVIIADRTSEVTEQAKKLKELDNIKSHFFANISHEFRTPLTLILGQSDSMLSQASNKKSKNKLNMILRNGKMLLNLINQLLDISKIEDGSMELKAARGNLIPFVKSLIFLWESLADQKQITLQFQTNQEEIELYFDPEKLEKVFYNLLSNAFKFTPTGGVVKIEINSNQENNKTDLITTNFVEITVNDTGIGIPANQLPNIFNRFYQADSSHTQQGTGIGLSLAKELVELHYGKISVTSKYNEGTTFNIRLPLGNSHLKKIQIIDIKNEDKKHEYKEIDIVDDSKPNALHTPIANNDNEIILVVEDHPDVRTYICEHLEDSYNLIVASNGKEGVAKAKETIPDLIITDIMMPEMDGYELSSILKNNETTSHIPIIMLTAKAAIESKIAGLETGADDYLTKPFSPKELLVRVRNLIELRKKLRERFSEAMVIKPADVTATSIDKLFLEKVVTSIETHISDELFGVEALASQLTMSTVHLNRKLNALIGQPASQLIRSTRLLKAVDLLQKKAGTVSEIGYMVGFRDHSSFTRSFKKKFGYSPSKYKTQ